ncbi:MAG: adenylate/guanylate cyclase domain-containing protein [Desulfobacterales bacterium]|nr:adenylate/guanylate cyclase domain-containing protein [Desulfobacterales bacterium]
MKPYKKIIKTGRTIVIFMGISFGANLIVSLCGIWFLYPMICFKANQGQIILIVEKAYKLMAMPISFIIPGIIIFLYLLPILKACYQIESNTVPSPLAKKRLLNAPLLIGIIGILGWVIFLIFFLAVIHLNHIHLNISGYISFILYIFLTGSLCFVIIYYSLEFIIRKQIIFQFFPDNRLTGYKGAIILSVKLRFYIYFFAVAVFPVFLFVSIIFAQINDNQIGRILLPILLLSFCLLLLGSFLTFLISSSYQTPLVQMKKAIKEIKSENYYARVEIVSNDEIGSLGEGINEMAGSLQEKEFIKDTFGKMVDPRVRDYLLKGNIELGGENKEATILFSDIRGFTNISEKMKPEKVVDLLNRFFEKMSLCITKENGLVNKFIGDALLAVFGVPIDLEKHPDAALKSAIRMKKVMDGLNIELVKQGLPTIEAGIGIHTGSVLAGNIGSSSRMEYTVIGDTVNLSSRLEGLTRIYGVSVLISENTFVFLEDPSKYSIRRLDRVLVKGKSEAIWIFEVFDSDPPEIRKLKTETLTTFETGLMLYSEQNFEKSIQIFQNCLSINPKDNVAKIYLARCQEFLIKKGNINWDGITKLDVK